ncbi:MAG TPA: SgcJ/EcaC family oxidoreductase [Candidatus Sulfopaludibacter sp.]|nr:SgcJ/EcaC family oxidoreductase [Candidatus Sulfopaludibacter sp.]
MKTPLMLLTFTWMFLGGCAVTGPTAGRTHPDPALADDLAAVRKLFADNAAALSAGDTSALARFYTADAIQFPPNSPALIGWEAIRSKLESELKGIKVAATVKVTEVVIAGDWTFARGTYRMVTTPQGGGEQTVAAGNWLDVLKRQPDRSWKIARSTWTIEE